MQGVVILRAADVLAHIVAVELIRRHHDIAHELARRVVAVFFLGVVYGYVALLHFIFEIERIHEIPGDAA